MTTDVSTAHARTSFLRRRRFWLLAIVVTVLAGVVALGDHRFSTGAAEGGQFGPSQSLITRSTIRLATFNIHGGKGTDDRRDLDRIATLLRGFDLVALNEVHGPQLFSSVDQSEALAEKLAMTALFAPTELRWGRPHFGNAVLTRVPVSSWRRVPLDPGADHSRRNMLSVEIPHGDRPLNVIITHISRTNKQTRAAQLKAVIDAFLETPAPAILLGDLNSTADDPLMRELLEAPGVGDPLAAARSKHSIDSIDWILTRGCTAIEGDIVPNDASDHPMLWVELKLPASAR